MEKVVNKAECVKEIAGLLGYDRAYVATIVECMNKVVTYRMSNGDTVKIIDGINLGGTFVEASETKKVNPQTGDRIIVKAHMKPTCKFTRTFKEKINNNDIEEQLYLGDYE